MFVLATASTPVPPPPEIFTTNIGDLVLAIIGTIAGLIGIIISIIIWRKVTSIEENRRNEQKKHFKKLVIDNIKEVLRLYDIITITSSRERHSEEDIIETTKELDKFFNKNKELILNLIRDTKFYASMLSVIDTPIIEDMDQVVNKIKWLTDEYYIVEHSIERNKRHWIGLGQELQNNKGFIERTLTSLNSL